MGTNFFRSDSDIRKSNVPKEHEWPRFYSAGMSSNGSNFLGGILISGNLFLYHFKNSWTYCTSVIFWQKEHTYCTSASGVKSWSLMFLCYIWFPDIRITPKKTCPHFETRDKFVLTMFWWNGDNLKTGTSFLRRDSDLWILEMGTIWVSII